MILTGNEPSMPIIEDNSIEGQIVRQMHYSGLTIRQHFAAIAMQGIVSKHGIIENTPVSVARESIRFADALINELNKTEKP